MAEPDLRKIAERVEQAVNLKGYGNAGHLFFSHDELALLRDALRDAERLSAVFEHCKVVYWPPHDAYPLEHNMRALGQKDSKQAILAAIDAAIAKERT